MPQALAHVHKASIEAVYEHWCKKRLKAKRPLLQRLWFEQPWVRVRDAGKEARPGTTLTSKSDLPFMGQDGPRAPATRPRRMHPEEALARLESIRCRPHPSSCMNLYGICHPISRDLNL